MGADLTGEDNHPASSACTLRRTFGTNLLRAGTGPTRSRTPLAYVAGTFGTLVGADLLNMPRVRRLQAAGCRLQAAVVSIGGAGTFDGVFLTGLVAVLLASL